MRRVGRLILVAGLLLGLAPPAAPAAPSSPHILEVVEVSGVLAEADVRRMEQFAEEVAENERVKAVLLVIDSPGGSVVETAHLYDVLARLKVPVVAWCNTVCASGGIYIAMAPSVKWIAVRRGAITGSVGVVAVYTQYHRLLEWAKIDTHTFKSGLLKDTGNPTRALTDADRAYIQGIVDSLAQEFYAVVERARPGVRMDVLRDARIVFPDDAVRLGLVDAVMTKAEAIAKAKQLAGAEPIYTREELKKMAKAAEGPSAYRYESPPREPPALDRLVALLDEVRSGTSLRFEYRLLAEF